MLYWKLCSHNLQFLASHCVRPFACTDPFQRSHARTFSLRRIQTKHRCVDCGAAYCTLCSFQPEPVKSLLAVNSPIRKFRVDCSILLFCFAFVFTLFEVRSRPRGQTRDIIYFRSAVFCCCYTRHFLTDVHRLVLMIRSPTNKGRFPSVLHIRVNKAKVRFTFPYSPAVSALLIIFL